MVNLAAGSLDMLSVSVVYAALDGSVFQQSVQVSTTAKIRDAIIASGFLQNFPEFEIEKLSVGVYSLRKTLDDGLHDKDRIEIYRPLLIDPKDRRRKSVDDKRDPAKWRRER